MKASAAVNILSQTKNSQDHSFYGGNNPFCEIERMNYDKIVRCSSFEKKAHSSVLREFDKWDMLVTLRLQQVSQAVIPELHHKSHLILLRKLSKYGVFWMIFGRYVRYRIIRSREDGLWELAFFNRKADSRYGQNDLVRVRFVLDERSRPTGFQLCRGADNKMFRTHSLSEDELTRALLCHFSRISCGSNLQDDLNHLRFLHENEIISTTDYVYEKRSLLENRLQEKFYIMPANTDLESVKQKIRVAFFLTIVGILLIAAVSLLVEKSGMIGRNLPAQLLHVK